MVLVYPPEDLEELFEKAEENPEEDFHLSTALRQNLLKPLWTVDPDQDFVDDWMDTIDEVDLEHPLLEAIQKLPEWIRDRDYEDAKEALEIFYEALESAQEKNWKTVSILIIEQTIQLKEELAGHSLEKDLEKATEILLNFYDGKDVHLGNAGRLVQLVIDNLESAEESTIDKVGSYCLDQAEILQKRGKYAQELEILKDAYKLSKCLDKNVSDVESRIIDSWENRFEEASDNSLRKLILIEDALHECQFAPKSKKNQWKKKLQEIAPKAVKNMSRRETVFELKRSTVNRIVKKIGELADKRTPLFVLYSLVMSRPHVSYIGKERKFQPTGILDVIQKKKMSKIGTSSPTDYSSSEEIVSIIRETKFAEIFTELLDQQVFKKEDFLELTKCFEGLEAEDYKYFSEITEDIIRGRYISAFYVGIPHFERVLLKMLNEKDETIIALKEDGSITTSLGSLIDKLEEYSDSRYVDYLHYTYTESGGRNRRNLAAHGLVSYGSVDKRIVTSLLLDILGVGCEMNSEKLKDKLGEPQRLL